MRIGPISFSPNLILAPMAGVTDKPFRILCKQMGAGLCVSEMTSSDPRFWKTDKSRLRMDHEGEPEPISVQIAGTDPQILAEAARFNADHGAQIIDINMGCPAKKVCNVLAGSALMQDEILVQKILSAVVAAVDVPVTLKMRTGWCHETRNALAIAHIALDCGIQALSIHGRTRMDFYEGRAEYDTIAEVKSRVAIPVFANGDINNAEQAAHVLQVTGADAILIGRAAQGRPWIFQEIAHFLKHSEHLVEPSPLQVQHILLSHLQALYAFYGEERGVRIARKHLGWYAKDRPENQAFRNVVNAAQDASQQLSLTQDYFDALVAGVSPEFSIAA